MHGNPGNKNGSRSATEARRAIRFLLNPSGQGWRRFPLTKALSAFQGELALPEYAGQRLRVAFAHLGVDKDGMRSLARLECAEWQLDSEGRVDQDVLMKGIVDRVDPVGHEIDFRLLATVTVTNQDVRAIRQQLGLPDLGNDC